MATVSGPSKRMTETARVSVVIPARNAAATLPAVLASLSDQLAARPDAEAIVVDNGSVDRTREIAVGAGVRVLDLLTPGAAAARNIGWRASHGELIAFLDSDCIPQPRWLDTLVAALDDAPRAGAAGGRVIAAPPTTLLQRYQARAGYYFNAELAMSETRMPYLLVGNSCYRRTALEQLHGFDETLRSGEDTDLSWRMQLRLELELAYAPDAVVEHVHRTAFREFWRQWVRYGYGGAQLAQRYPRETDSFAQSARRWKRPFQELARSAGALARLPLGRADVVDVLAPLLRCVEIVADRFGHLKAYRDRRSRRAL